MTAARLQEIALRLGFHAFRDQLQPQALAHDDDGARNGGVLGVARNVADEGAGDLESIDGKAAQVAERGIAGAEIVDSETHAELAQVVELRGARLHQHALGALELQEAGLAPARRQGLSHRLRMSGSRELAPGIFQCHSYAAPPLRAPARELCAWGPQLQ